MKALALAIAVAAGVVCSAGTADAQFRSRGSYRTYSYPTYTYPTYSYAPSYYSGVVTSSYTPYTSSGVVVTSGYTPTYSSAVYPSSYYYPSSYSYPSTWNTPYYGSYYSGYGSGVYISPSGGMWRGRGWRW